jgi:hypothetical protein
MPALPRVALCALVMGLIGSSGHAEISDELSALVTPVPLAQPAAALTDPAAHRTEEALARKQDYYVVLQPVQTLLETVAGDSGLRLSYSDDVKGVVRKLRASGTTSEVLDAIATSMGLDWFTFNGIIYVSSRTEAATRLVRLGDLTPGQAITAIGEAGLPVDRVEMRPTSVDNVLALSGPPELLAIAEAVIESIPPHVVRTTKAKPSRTVLIRRGNDEQMVTLRQ